MKKIQLNIGLARRDGTSNTRALVDAALQQAGIAPSRVIEYVQGEWQGQPEETALVSFTEFDGWRERVLNLAAILDQTCIAAGWWSPGFKLEGELIPAVDKFDPQFFKLGSARLDR